MSGRRMLPALVLAVLAASALAAQDGSPRPVTVSAASGEAVTTVEHGVVPVSSEWRGVAWDAVRAALGLLAIAVTWAWASSRP